MTELQYRVPATVEDMLPPKASSLVTEAANFLRAHWEEVKEDFQVLSGEKPSEHGSLSLDDAACVFKIQKIAKANGFAFLGSVRTNKLRRALRFGYKRNSGTSMKLLFQQYKQLRIEDRRQEQTKELRAKTGLVEAINFSRPQHKAVYKEYDSHDHRR